MSSTENSRAKALQMIQKINAVEGFDPAAFAVEYTDLGSGESRKRLPVMAQLAWFRLKYPEGRISATAQPTKDGFVATARVYMHHNDPVDCFLAEATASRGASPDKPSVSPREWAQTAAVGIALRNAGFGLQFHAAGESFDEPAFDETGVSDTTIPSVSATEKTEPITAEPSVAEAPEEPKALTYEDALLLPCPISKHSGKTLDDLIVHDPAALTWLATKYSGDAKISEGARLICEKALQDAA